MSEYSTSSSEPTSDAMQVMQEIQACGLDQSIMLAKAHSTEPGHSIAEVQNLL